LQGTGWGLYWCFQGPCSAQRGLGPSGSRADMGDGVGRHCKLRAQEGVRQGARPAPLVRMLEAGQEPGEGPGPAE
jgi:hypothetical protein